MDETDADSADFSYDEFAYFSENCEEFDLPWDGSAEVSRMEVPTTHGSVSALRWGSDPAALVLLHGGAQNAHTWDTVALALRPTSLVAIDLPGHGHSAWRDDADYGPDANAAAVVGALDSLATSGVLDAPVVLVGMSLGGLTANAVAASRPDLVRRLAVVDITPGVNQDKAKEIHDFVTGPQSFAGFGEILERTMEYNPTRSRSSLRRGILHNAHRRADGSWEWNYDRARPKGEGFPDSDAAWAVVANTTMPYLLVRGADSPVVDDDDVAELRRLRPDARVEVVAAAGHSIQGDQPLELARIISEELSAG